MEVNSQSGQNNKGKEHEMALYIYVLFTQSRQTLGLGV